MSNVNGSNLASAYSWTLVCLLLVLIVALTRYLTGPEWALSIFFIVPIALVSWKVNRAAGFGLAAVGFITWLWADLMLLPSFSSPWVPVINETFRTIVFVGVVIILSRLKSTQNSLKRMAWLDDLTGLANRRALFNLAPLWIGGARRNHQKVAIGYLDVDQFKQVNDLMGHAVGDRVLRVIGETLRQETRITDMAVRLGGDEFAIFWCVKNEESVCRIAEALIRALTRKMRANHWPITFSLGLVMYVDHYPNIETMIERADRMMYQAKSGGRNQIRKEIVGREPETQAPFMALN